MISEVVVKARGGTYIVLDPGFRTPSFILSESIDLSYQAVDGACVSSEVGVIHAAAEFVSNAQRAPRTRPLDHSRSRDDVFFLLAHSELALDDLRLDVLAAKNR